MDIEQLAEQVLQTMESMVERRLRPILGDIAQLRLDVAGAGYLKSTDSSAFAAAEDTTRRIDELSARVKELATDVAARPTLDLMRAEQATVAGKAAADIVQTIRIPQDGKSVTVDDVRPLLDQMVSAIPRPKDGANGRDGVDGKDAEVDYVAIYAAIDQRIDAKVAEIPMAKDGANGRDGTDGKDGADGRDGNDGLPGARGEPGTAGKDADIATVREIVTIAVKAAVADIPTPKDGADGRDADPVDMDVVGKLIESHVRLAVDALPRPKDGADGLGIEDFDLDLKEDGRTLVFRFAGGGREKTFEIVAPWQLYRGIYKADERYTLGDTCTYGGSQWVATREKLGKPGDPDSGWQLCVKRGANA